MKVYRFKTKEKVYGFLEPKDGSIWIREDMRGIDYIDTFMHEFKHWIIIKILPVKLHRFFNCWFDMIDGFINTFSIKLVKKYYRFYYEI